MSSERLERVESLYHSALARPAAERAAFLASACGDDHALRAEVESLLAHAASAPSFLERAPRARTLANGSRLGSYEILDVLGIGGMGEVYRARDPRLGRDVALKLLPAELADDPERRQRFEREARAAAALTHPNIVTLYSIEADGGIQFLTMEIVEGRTLAELLPRGGFPIDRVLQIAMPVAEALGEAHARGIVHRDLKPANVMVANDGRVKILDFGLAKRLVAGTGGETATVELTAERTRDGRLLGTVAYMSPEQAEGADVDHRSDIFSFGVLLYEITTGQRPFRGDTATALLSSILKDSPEPLSAVRSAVPRELSRLVSRCLEKAPRRRYQSVIDIAHDLESIEADRRRPATLGTVEPRRVRRFVAAGVAALVITGGAAAVMWPTAPEGRTVEKERFPLALPPGLELANPAAPTRLAISNDGRWVAFGARSTDPNLRGLYLRNIGELQPRRVGDGLSPFFSPDSKWLAFHRAGTIWKMPLPHGDPQPVCATKATLRGAAWADDGTIVFTDSADGILWRVRSDGGPPTALTGAGGERLYFPHPLPGGRTALVTLHTGLGDSHKTIGVVSLETGEIVRRFVPGSSPKYAGGQVVFRHLGDLYVAPFDISRLEIADSPRKVLENVAYYDGSGSSDFDVGSTGALVYVTARPLMEDRDLVWLDEKGRTEPALPERRAFSGPVLDPQGRRLAVRIRSTPERADLWVYDLATGTPVRITSGLFSSGSLAWSPDGRWIIASATRNGSPKLFRISPMGGDVVWLTDGGLNDFPGSSHGELVFFRRETRAAIFDFLAARFEGTSAAVAVLSEISSAGVPRISPNGRWLAYDSSEAGAHQVFVRPYPDAASRRWSAGPGWSPRWSRDGTRLFYRRADEIWAVPIRTNGSGLHLGAPILVVRHPALGDQIWTNPVQLSPDERRFLMVSFSPHDRQLVYVPRWLEEARAVRDGGGP